MHILIPAYNEGKSLEKVLQDLAKIKRGHKNLIKKVIVVNDGSTDKLTVEIAEKYADQVIHLKKNRGKARAFWEGLKICWSEKAKVMVILDADLKAVSETWLRALVKPLGRHGKNSAEIKMVVGERKGARDSFFVLNGERAFLMEAFRALMIRRDLQNILLRGGRKKGGHRKRVGFGLEIFLTNYFKDCVYNVSTGFEVGPATRERGRPGRTTGDRKRFDREVSAMMSLFEKRRQSAKQLRNSRAKTRKK